MACNISHMANLDIFFFSHENNSFVFQEFTGANTDDPNEPCFILAGLGPFTIRVQNPGEGKCRYCHNSPQILFANNKNPDQTAQMCSLVWVFAVLPMFLRTLCH